MNNQFESGPSDTEQRLWDLVVPARPWVDHDAERTGTLDGAGYRIYDQLSSSAQDAGGTGMFGRNAGRLAVVGLAIVSPLAACGGRDGDSGASGDCDPGISDNEVVLGGSSLQSGPGAAYKAQPDAQKAYFDDINADGGVKMADGKTRKIRYISMDDAYDPARAVSNVRKLVDQEDVFGLFGNIGTVTTLAVVDYAKAKDVPILFPLSGSDEFEGLVADGAPVAGMSAPQVSFEVQVMVSQIVQSDPSATIAVLYQNDGMGSGYLAALEKEIEGTDLKIVGAESYEQSAATVDSQMVALRDSGADVFLDFGTGSFVTQAISKAAELGWDATKYLISGATDTKNIVLPAGADAAEGIRSSNWLYDVSSSANDDVAGVAAWRQFADQHSESVDSKNNLAAVGYTNAQLMVAALETTEGCERSDLLEAAQNLSGVTTDLSLEGVTFNTTPDYPYTITHLAPMTFKDGAWVYGQAETRSED
jgi:branched-chain amino acid transport system substrate-binding protein